VSIEEGDKGWQRHITLWIRNLTINSDSIFVKDCSEKKKEKGMSCYNLLEKRVNYKSSKKYLLSLALMIVELKNMYDDIVIAGYFIKILKIKFIIYKIFVKEENL